MYKIVSSVLLMIFSILIVYADEADMSTKAIKTRIEPIGRAAISMPQPSAKTPEPTPQATTSPVETKPLPIPATNPSVPPSVPKNQPVAGKGENVYQTHCATCHASGLAGAPKLGDSAAWKPRVSQGLAILVQHATNGYKMMPPKGTCMDCSNEDLVAAIKYMVNNSGGKL